MDPRARAFAPAVPGLADLVRARVCSRIAAGIVTAAIRLETEVDPTRTTTLSNELRQIIAELSLSASLRIQRASRSAHPVQGAPDGRAEGAADS